MKLLSCSIAVAFFTTVSIANADADSKPNKTARLYMSHYENVLGTSLELKISATSPQEAEKAEAAVLHEIGRLSKILSAYDTNSEFSQWLKTSQKAMPVSHELFEVLNLFDQWRLRTSGALDASAEVIAKLWKKAAARQQIPTADELTDAVEEVKQSHWKLDATMQTATHLSHSPLVLNSFAKSYIIRKAADAAMAFGKVKAVIVNIGGDLVVSGNLDEMILISNPKADAENEAPIDQLRISNKAVATSGNYRRGELINGQWYSHIVDPRTGLHAGNIISATVIAPNATDAGALATAFNVLSTSESVKLAQTIPGSEYLIITGNGERIASPGWNALEIPANTQMYNKSIPNKSTPIKSTPINRIATAKEKLTTGSNSDFEMVINLEINVQKEGFVKRPYVAVWVEDENHAPIRTITVWHGNDRYLPELKSWFLKYRGLYTSDKSFNSSVTSATRSAGKYTIKWDGKDDQGNFVKPGKYIIKIEASREHGTYQLMRQEIDCDQTPKIINLTGNIEIAAASLDYRKK
jgi:FAD:protein FMN transferase